MSKTMIEMNTNTAVAAGQVPNGTRILTPEVVSYVERYQTFARQTAESVLMLGRTLVEAKEKLNPADFIIFCEEVDIDERGSIFKKLMVIGQSFDRLQPFAHKLPNTWTTIYKLAALKPAELDYLVSSDVLTPFMTAKDIANQLDVEQKATVGSEAAPQADFVISMSSLDIVSKESVYQRLYDLQAEYKFNLTPARTLTDEIVEHKKALAA